MRAKQPPAATLAAIASRTQRLRRPESLAARRAVRLQYTVAIVLALGVLAGVAYRLLAY